MSSCSLSRSCLAWLLAGLASLPGLGLAQDAPPPPPVPPPVDESQPPAGNDPYAEDPYLQESQDPYAPAQDPYAPAQDPASRPNAPANGQGAETEAATSQVERSNQTGAGVEAQRQDQPAQGEEIAPLGAAPNEEKRLARKASLRRQSTLTGSTGLLRIREAGSSAPGTFRLSFKAGLNAMSNFLCTEAAPCVDPVTGQIITGDSSQRSDSRLTLTVTPLPFLEAFAGIRNVATSNSLGTPQVVQIVGDWNLGVKGFFPAKPDRLWGLGSELDLLLLNGSGGVGLAGGATSLTIRGIGSLDLGKMENAFPLRLHGNVAYVLDNSGAVVGDFETTPPAQGGRGEPIERTERYGLDISRVDTVDIGLGAEYINKWVRPFLEWSIEIPSNRQGHVCSLPGAASRGDECLGAANRFETVPSRLTLGARGFPWQQSGLAISLAIDIGTGGTSRFLEEMTPEAPYTVWLGLSYGVDATPIPEVRVVETQPEPPPKELRRYAEGRVVDAKTGDPIPDARLHYAGGSRTGLITGEAGAFRTQDLPPGSYELKIFAHEYNDGSCKIVIPEVPPQQATTSQTSGTAPAAHAAGAQTAEGTQPAQTATTGGAQAPPAAAPGGARGPEDQQPSLGLGPDPQATAQSPGQQPAAQEPQRPYVDDQGHLIVPVTCELKPLPRVATITGVLVDAKTGSPVADASVRITDKLGRSLELSVDSQGAFQFRNVPFGTAQLHIEAPGYLDTVREFSIASREEITENLVLNPIPEDPNVKITDKELAFSQSISFIEGTAQVAEESMAVIEELALVLSKNPQIKKVEVQVHTDDSGSPTRLRRISQDRAQRISELLQKLGVRKERLAAKGYGPDQPLAPNVSDANRARNARVEVVILEQE